MGYFLFVMSMCFFVVACHPRRPQEHVSYLSCRCVCFCRSMPFGDPGACFLFFMSMCVCVCFCRSMHVSALQQPVSYLSCQCVCFCGRMPHSAIQEQVSYLPCRCVCFCGSMPLSNPGACFL